jgi:hypothetical protein
MKTDDRFAISWMGGQMVRLNCGGKDYGNISTGEYQTRFEPIASPALTAVENIGKLLIISYF